MKNPITMAANAVEGWVSRQSPSTLGGMAFGLITAGGLALIALGGHVDSEAIMNEVLDEEGLGENDNQDEIVIDVTDEAVVVE